MGSSRADLQSGTPLGRLRLEKAHMFVIGLGSSSSGGFLAPQDISPVHKRAKRRHDAGVLREIRKLQRSTGLLVPSLPFSRVVREVATQCGQQELRLALLTRPNLYLKACTC